MQPYRQLPVLPDGAQHRDPPLLLLPPLSGSSRVLLRHGLGDPLLLADGLLLPRRRQVLHDALSVLLGLSGFKEVRGGVTDVGLDERSRWVVPEQFHLPVFAHLRHFLFGGEEKLPLVVFGLLFLLLPRSYAVPVRDVFL